MKIVITPRTFQAKGQKPLEMLKKKGYTVIANDLERRFTIEEVTSHVTDADAILTGNDLLSKEVLGKAPKLKVISKYGVGLDNIDVDYAKGHGIVVCKASGANSVSVAEMTISLILSASRNLMKLAENSKNHVDERVMGSEVYKKALGILGLGAIGSHVAKIADAMGMKIMGYDPYVDANKLPSYIHLTSMEEILKNSDVISLHLPLLNDTKEMFNEKLFAKMKSTAILINTARGGLVNQDALYKALVNGKLAYAAEDVELKERKNELVQLSNYMITPHAASFTEESDQNTIRISVQNILDVLERKE